MANDVLSTDDNHVITVDAASNVMTQNAYHNEWHIRQICRFCLKIRARHRAGTAFKQQRHKAFTQKAGVL